MDLPVEIGAGISEVEIADPALDGQRRLGEAVVVALREEMLDLEIADARIEAERAVRALVLAEQAGGGRPMLGEIDAQSGAAAGHVDVVKLFSTRASLLTTMPPGLRQEGAGAGDIVDIAGVVLVPADDAQRGACR